jgi:hypothetical protein
VVWLTVIAFFMLRRVKNQPEKSKIKRIEKSTAD